MIEYKDIKSARKELIYLQNMTKTLQKRQEELRYHIHNGYFDDRDIRLEIFDNRIMLGRITKKIKRLNKTILKLDRESTQRDVERQIKESLARQLKEE